MTLGAEAGGAVGGASPMHEFIAPGATLGVMGGGQLARMFAHAAQQMGYAVAVLDPDLREKDWGTWEGLTTVERDRVEFVGESTEAHQERILRALRRIAERHPGGRVLVVTHGGSMRRVQTAALGMALPVVENCGVWICACQDGTFRPVD